MTPHPPDAAPARGPSAAARLVPVLALAALMALGTALLGWPAVPFAAAAAAVVRTPRGRRPLVTPGAAALAGALAWGGFLAAAAARGQFGAQAAVVAGIVGRPAAVAVALTLLLPAVLAWAAAALAAGVASLVRPARDSQSPDPSLHAGPPRPVPTP